MRDFTINTFIILLNSLKKANYKFQTFAEYLKSPEPRVVILRHDVDAKKLNSLRTARIEAEMGIKGTYYFRIVPQSFDPEIIRQIAALGHEIGYHYEDLAMARGNMERAITLFSQNLISFRRIVRIETICMHGSPLSRYDNRKIWEKFNYRDFGISGEPYFDLDFNKVLYLTDTGRRWDGEKVSVRDRLFVMKNDIGKLKVAENFRIHTSFDIIESTRRNQIPANLMITIHPQRWDNEFWPWILEFIMQKQKNILKNLIVLKNKNSSSKQTLFL